ncbi:MAG: hypothetical protein HRT72_00675 [Flavobacteriales bacterium]|nr:hypothetical protein [Flavobacteriales bacterium]
MKLGRIIYLISAITFVQLSMLNNVALAQEEEDEGYGMSISGGVGFGNSRDIKGYDAGRPDSKMSMVYHVDVDKNFTPTWSGGLALAMRNAQSTNTALVEGVTKNLTRKIGVYGINARVLYNLSSDSRYDFTLGGRVGYMIFNYRYDKESFEPTENDETKNKLNIAPTIAFKAYLGGDLAIKADLVIAKYPYTFGVGLSYRIGG